MPVPAAKRALDVTIAGVGLVVLAPVLLLVALLITATSPARSCTASTATAVGAAPSRS